MDSFYYPSAEKLENKRIREIWQKEGREDIHIMMTVYSLSDQTALFQQRMMLLANGWSLKK